MPGFCELGGVTLGSALADVRSFLVSNPGEVSSSSTRTRVSRPPRSQQAFEQAGLLDLVYRGPLGPFPTLRADDRLKSAAAGDGRERSRRRAVVPPRLRARAAGDTVPLHATPPQLTDPAKLPASCRPTAARPPRRSSGQPLGGHHARAPRLARVGGQRPRGAARAGEACQRDRGRLPNLVAVDFFRRGRRARSRRRAERRIPVTDRGRR